MLPQYCYKISAIQFFMFLSSQIGAGPLFYIGMEPNILLNVKKGLPGLFPIPILNLLCSIKNKKFNVTVLQLLLNSCFVFQVERQSESTCTEKTTLSLKAAANVVKAAATLVCNTPYAQREDAVMSRKLIESTLSL